MNNEGMDVYEIHPLWFGLAGWGANVSYPIEGGTNLGVWYTRKQAIKDVTEEMTFWVSKVGFGSKLRVYNWRGKMVKEITIRQGDVA